MDNQLVTGARHDFLTPVTNDVAQEAGIVLRRVVQAALSHPATVVAICTTTSAYLSLTTEFVYRRSLLYTRRIHELVKQVAVPVDTTVYVVGQSWADR